MGILISVVQKQKQAKPSPEKQVQPSDLMRRDGAGGSLPAGRRMQFIDPLPGSMAALGQCSYLYGI